MVNREWLSFHAVEFFFVCRLRYRFAHHHRWRCYLSWRLARLRHNQPEGQRKADTSYRK